MSLHWVTQIIFLFDVLYFFFPSLELIASITFLFELRYYFPLQPSNVSSSEYAFPYTVALVNSFLITLKWQKIIEKQIKSMYVIQRSYP